MPLSAKRRGTCTVKYVTGMQNGTGQPTGCLKEGISNYDGRHFSRKALAGIGDEVKRKISD